MHFESFIDESPKQQPIFDVFVDWLVSLGTRYQFHIDSSAQC